VEEELAEMEEFYDVKITELVKEDKTLDKTHLESQKKHFIDTPKSS